MKLTFDQLRGMITGAVRFWEEDGLLRMSRFTEEQDKLYETVSEAFHMKALASAGMRLMFRTDSRSLTLKVVTDKGSTRRFFSYDVFVDGKPAGYLGNYAEPMPEDYIPEPYPLGEFSGTVNLGEGEKTVCVYMPWTVSTAIREVSLDDGAFAEPAKPEKLLLAYGDSITQGYDAPRPSQRYASKLADFLGAAELNKAIGAEIFRPELAQLPDPVAPDYISVAYGTNDWSKTDEPTLRENSRAFYSALSRNYPSARIFALTPICRKDHRDYRPFGPFARVEEVLREAVQDLENVTVIRCFDFLPEDAGCFSDKYLHPNARGFDLYARHLCAAVEAVL